MSKLLRTFFPKREEGWMVTRYLWVYPIGSVFHARIVGEGWMFFGD